MSEDKETKGTEKEATKDDSGEGDNAKTISELDRADQIAERLKRENDRKDELLTREENLQARKVIGGGSEAGSVKEKLSKEEIESRARVQRIGEAAGASWAKKKEE